MLVRQSLRQLLEPIGKFHILGEAADGVAAVEQVKTLKPDLLILDAAMPKATGVEVVEEVRRWSPDTKIAVVTGVNAPGMLQHLLDADVDGLFLKSGDTQAWAADFEAVCQGEKRIDPALNIDASGAQTLTGRERQILFCIARGESNAKISEALGISPNTVDKHRTSIMRKLNVHSAAELISKAFKDGLLDSTSG